MISSVKKNTVKYQKEWMKTFNEEFVNHSLKNSLNEHSFDNSNLINPNVFSKTTGIATPGKVNMAKSNFIWWYNNFFE